MTDSADDPSGSAMRWHATALDTNDNVATLLEAVAASQDVIVDVGGKPVRVQALEPIALGHKIALTDLRAGDLLVKYGEVIGEASVPVARGAWVHVHNLRSLRGRAGGTTNAQGQTAKVAVTEKGFEPDSVTLRANIPARITFIRTTDKTCATEVVFPSKDIKRALPLNEAVVIEFTPEKAGTIAFVCGMNMLKGAVVVE